MLWCSLSGLFFFLWKQVMGTAVTPVHVHVPSATAIVLHHHVPQKHQWVALCRVHQADLSIAVWESHVGKGGVWRERTEGRRGLQRSGVKILSLRWEGEEIEAIWPTDYVITLGLRSLGPFCSILSCDYRKTCNFSAQCFPFCKVRAAPFKIIEPVKSWGAQTVQYFFRAACRHLEA